jgi:hypothetical protein
MNVAICLLYLLNNTLLNDYDATQNIGRTKSIGIIISLQQKIQAADTVRKLKIQYDRRKAGKGKIRAFRSLKRHLEARSANCSKMTQNPFFRQ